MDNKPGGGGTKLGGLLSGMKVEFKSPRLGDLQKSSAGGSGLGALLGLAKKKD